MSLDNRISSIIKSCFVQLRNFRLIHPLKSKTVAITLANSFMHFLLHYAIAYFKVFLITKSTVCKRFKVQQLALSLVVSVHHTLLQLLNLCIGYLLTTV